MEQVTLAAGLDPVRIQRPEIVGSRWQRTLSVPDKGWTMVVFPRGFHAAPDQRLVLRYRAEVKDLPPPARTEGK